MTRRSEYFIEYEIRMPFDESNKRKHTRFEQRLKELCKKYDAELIEGDAKKW